MKYRKAMAIRQRAFKINRNYMKLGKNSSVALIGLGQFGLCIQEQKRFMYAMSYSSVALINTMIL